MKLLKIILAIFLISVIWSCGSRKVDKHETQQEFNLQSHGVTDTKTETEIKAGSVKNTLQNDFVLATEKEAEFTPIDPVQPINVIQGKDTLKVTNAKFTLRDKNTRSQSEKKETQHDTTTLSNKSVKSEKNDIKASGKSKQLDEHKKRDGTAATVFVTFSLLLILLLVIILVIKYIKDKSSFS